MYISDKDPQQPNSYDNLLCLAINNYENNNMDVAISQFITLTEYDYEEAFLYLSLIYLYEEENGIKKDELKAFRYKRQYVQTIENKAAIGLSKFKLKLAYILQFGDGVPIDDTRAFLLFLDLAKAGSAEAQFHLSRIYAQGLCNQNVNTELEWYWLNEATKLEFPVAIYYSALFLESNPNEEGMITQRTKMMNKAAELGCWQAKEYLGVKEDR